MYGHCENKPDSFLKRLHTYIWGLTSRAALLQPIRDEGKWGEGYLCSTNYTVSLTTKTINIKMANTVVAKVSTLVRNKVTKTVSNPKHNC